MKLVYKDMDSLMKQVGNVLIKNRIEHASPPMDIDFKEEQIDSIEMDFGDDEQIIDDAMEIIRDENDGDISFDESKFDVATVNVEVLSTYSYKLSFQQFQFGQGAAAACVLFVCLFIVALIYLKTISTSEVD